MIQIEHQYKTLPVPEKLLAGAAREVYRLEGVDTDRSTVIILCSDHVIRRLNRDYRGKDRATDVLSFPFGDDDLLGEVYISLQRAKVQANRYGVTYNEELRRLLIHGLLHLMGYDHIRKTDRETMEARERAYMADPPTRCPSPDTVS